MNELFKSEQEAIEFVKLYLPIGIKSKSKKPTKTYYLNPFTSHNAFEITAESLGKSLFKLQESKRIATNKDI